MQKDDTLLIVGNGLDLSFNLPTSYHEFMIDKDTKEAMNKCNGFDALKCV